MNVYIIGAGGHAKVIADIVPPRTNVRRVNGYFDDNIPSGSMINGVPVIGKIEKCTDYYDDFFIIGIGNNMIRKQISNKYPLNYITLIHSNAVVGSNVTVGCGSTVMAGVVIETTVEIGRHCIINTGATVNHDGRVGDYTHICPNASIAGSVIIGSECTIGIGASVINNVSICDGVTVGAGAVVVKDITESGTYAGVPVRRIR